MTKPAVSRRPTPRKRAPSARAKPNAARSLFRALGQVDWPSALQRAGVLMRALRGESAEQIAADGSKTLDRGQRLYRTVEGAARQAVGCRAPNPCDCMVCHPEDWKEGR